MNNPERALSGPRGGTTRRKWLLALAALGGAALVPRLSSKIALGSASFNTPSSDSAPSVAIPEKENSEYRKLTIIKADDAILAESTKISFDADDENILDGINEDAQKSGYLTFRSGKYADKILLPTPMDPELEKKLQDSIGRINRQLGSNQNINLVLFVYELGNGARLNGTGYGVRSTGKNVIEFSVAPNREVTIGEMMVVANNEASHLDFRANHSDLYQSDELGDFFDKFMNDAEDEAIAQTRDPESILYQQDVIRILDHSPRDLRTQIRATAENALFHVFMEKSYLGEGGHPWDGSEELFTSATTVLDLFPKSFIATTSKLAPEDQRMVKEFGKFVVEKLGEDRFSGTLVKFLKG